MLLHILCPRVFNIRLNKKHTMLRISLTLVSSLTSPVDTLSELHLFKVTGSILAKKLQKLLFSKYGFLLKFFLITIFSLFFFLLCLSSLQGLLFCCTFDELESWWYLQWWQKESSISKVLLLKIFEEKMELYSNKINRIGNFPNIWKSSEKWASLELF